MEFSGPQHEFFLLDSVDQPDCEQICVARPGELRVFWTSDGRSALEIDGIPLQMEENQMLFLTEFHQLKVQKLGGGRYFRFNRPFYCLDNHDGEIGCRGVLFFGSADTSLIGMEREEVDQFALLWWVFTKEMKARDSLQLEMLRMLLKRWLILCLRVYKRQHDIVAREDSSLQVIREFNYLVELHFRRLHNVQEYASMLNKSPKTIANLFSKYEKKRPLKVIQDRILQEARRLLLAPEKPVSQVAYDLGFTDVQSFSRFFSNKAGESPSSFRKSRTAG